MSSRTSSIPADSQPKHSRHSTGDVDYSMRKMVITGKEEKEVTVAPCQPPALRDGQQVVTSFSNIYKLTVKQETIVWRYDVAVSAEMNNRVIRLSAGARDNAIHRKEVCQTIMSVGLKTVLSKNEFHIYDGAKCLFVNADIYDRITQRSNVIYLSEAQLPPAVKKLLDMVDLKEIRIEINIPMEGDSSFDLGQYCKARQADDLSNLDRTPLQCLELLTTSPAISSGAFTAIGDRKLFLKNVPGKDVGRGQEERLGLVKGIRILETEKKQPIAAMTVDARTALFFKPQPLIQTVRELMGWRPEDDHYPFDFESDDWAKINDYIGGLRVTLSYGSMKYNFITSGISKIPLKDITFECHQTGNRVHAIDNYKNVLPHWPAVIMKKRLTDKTGEQKEILLHFPLDLLQIAANQMVPPYKQSEQKPIPMHIETRFSKINSMLHKIYGGVDAQILDAFGVHISESPMTATGIRRSLPNVVFRGEQAVIFNSSSSSWRMERNLKYVAAAKLNDVVVACDTFKREDVQSVENMKNKLATLAKQQGLTARWHVFSTSNGSTHQKIVNLFEYVKAEKVNGNLGPLVLIIYVDSISNTESHNVLKLYEIQYQIPTQQITMEVAKTVPSRGITACNILHKMNAKMGGLNYKVIPDKFSRDSWISNKESLVIGYDVSHPTGSSGEVLGYKKPPTLPSIIGMSFNGAEHPENFIGDFHYQEPRKEQVTSSILTDRVQWMLNLFTKHRKLPENIIILRDGVSDGQFKMVVDEEFEAIKRGIDIYKQKNNVKNWTPKFVVAIVTKRHNNRFASLNEKGLPVNHVPGTVIDKELVRSDITHFFMLSHNVLKGTGKLPSYYIPINELKTADTESQDRLQSMFLGLSFLHQVSQNSVSLPEPVYQADEWAKRGKNLWTAYCNTSQRLPRLSNWNKKLYSSAPLDFEEMSKRLCYQNTALEQFRTNA